MKVSKVNLLRISIGIILLLAIYIKIGIGDLVSNISKANPLILSLTVIMLILSYFFAALNIKIITDFIRSLPYFLVWKYYALSWAIGLFFPGKLGEFSLAFFLKKNRFSMGEGIAVALIDKMITVACLGFLAVIGFFIYVGYIAAGYLFISLIALFLAFIFLVSNKTIRIFIRKNILRKYESKFSGFYRNFQGILRKKSKIFLNILLTFIKWFFGSLAVFFVFLSLGTNVSIFQIYIINAVLTIVALIPITISGSGTVELAAIPLYALGGVSADITISAYLLIRIINYLMAGLLLLTFTKGLKGILHGHTA